LSAVLAPILTSGNTAIVLAHPTQPLSAISFAEVLATSDVPGGVVNILTGDPAPLMPWLAAHADVNALDLAGGSEGDWVTWQSDAAETLKRVLAPSVGIPARSVERIVAFTELKTVWHTKALG
jgi:acyl-CoA reductase-like NAD-dependent aldehyde dehydrogenase